MNKKKIKNKNKNPRKKHVIHNEMIYHLLTIINKSNRKLSIN